MSEVRVKVTCNEPGAYHEGVGESTLAVFVQDAYFHAWSDDVVISASAQAAMNQWRTAIETSEHPSDVAWPFEGSAFPPGALGAGVRPSPVTYILGGKPVERADLERVAALVDRTTATGEALPEAQGYAMVSLKCGCGIAVDARAKRVWPILDILAQHHRVEITLRQLAARLDPTRQ